MNKVDDLLRYAHDRVHTTPTPFGLFVKAERKRAILDVAITAAICSSLALLIELGPTETKSPAAPSPWTTRQLVALNMGETR